MLYSMRAASFLDIRLGPFRTIVWRFGYCDQDVWSPELEGVYFFPNLIQKAPQLLNIPWGTYVCGNSVGMHSTIFSVSYLFRCLCACSNRPKISDCRRVRTSGQTQPDLAMVGYCLGWIFFNEFSQSHLNIDQRQPHMVLQHWLANFGWEYFVGN